MSCTECLLGFRSADGIPAEDGGELGVAPEEGRPRTGRLPGRAGLPPLLPAAEAAAADAEPDEDVVGPAGDVLVAVRGGGGDPLRRDHPVESGDLVLQPA